MIITGKQDTSFIAITCDRCSKEIPRYEHEEYNSHCKECAEIIAQEKLDRMAYDSNEVFDFYGEKQAHCSICKKYVLADEVLEHEGLDYCQSCYNKFLLTCSNCDSISDDIEEIYEYEGERYCEECYNELFFICEHCGNTYRQDEGRWSSTREMMYCEDCFNQEVYTCKHCGEEIPAGEHRLGPDSCYYCQVCWDNYFSFCDNCEEVFDNDEMRYSEEDGCYYCEHCYAELDNNIIHNYTYEPEWRKYKLAYENTLYMGIELETEHEDMRGSAKGFDNFLENKGLKDYFYFKEDGSINGIEIVTMPITYKYMREKVNWRETLDYLKNNGFSSYDNRKCGLHIHTNKDFFSTREIAKLRLFFESNYTFIHKFSQRGSSGNTYTGREHYGLSKYKYDCKNNYIASNDTRYVSLNSNTGKGTIEFRIFQGTLDYTRFKATLQFVEALCHFIKLSGYGAQWHDFLLWAKQTNRYREMLNYCDKRNIG